jgi:hypothetical protein
MAMREPMTATEARENIDAMKAETPVNAQRTVLKAALGGFGNLSDGAREIYEARLAEI